MGERKKTMGGKNRKWPSICTIHCTYRYCTVLYFTHWSVLNLHKKSNNLLFLFLIFLIGTSYCWCCCWNSKSTISIQWSISFFFQMHISNDWVLNIWNLVAFHCNICNISILHIQYFKNKTKFISFILN